MDEGVLESIVKPWWLAPPAFMAVMILGVLVTAGCAGTSWFVEGILAGWLQSGW